MNYNIISNNQKEYIDMYNNILNNEKNWIKMDGGISNDVYYLGLSLATCRRLLPPIMTTRKMAEQIATGSIHFQRELKKVGLFKFLEGKAKRFSDPVVIQCEKVHPMVA